MKPIYEYIDYRKFLADFFTEEKRTTKHFSYRYAARKTGVDASNIAKIVQSKRHIKSEFLPGFVSLLRLDENEAEFLRLLINFSRARTDEKRRITFEKIIAFNNITANLIEVNRFEFYQHWYYTAVLALLYFFPVKAGQWNQIASQIQPKISDSQAKDAIELLTRLNFIKEERDGTYSHTDRIITSGESWNNIAINTFQQQTMELALDAMKNREVQDRHISTLTITISEELYPRLKSLTDEYRRAILKEVEECDNPSRVYQVNTQIFPLSFPLEQDNETNN